MKKEKVDVKRGCHYKKCVILNLIQDLQRTPLQLVNNLRGRSRIKYGMTPDFREEALNKNVFRAPLRSGFTLIEILVVVLIVGILAAVAVPQYQKAVEGTRIAEAISTLEAIEKGLDVYTLEHGWKEVYFFQPDNEVDPTDTLVIEMESSLDCSKDTQSCWGKNFAFTADCSSAACAASAFRRLKHGGAWGSIYESAYALVTIKMANSSSWTHTCVYVNEDNFAKAICERLVSQGWAGSLRGEEWVI